MRWRGVVERVLPERLGTSFRWLASSSWSTNLGDGIGLAAAPLLIASETQDPVLVALAGLLQRLPWLLFGLWAGIVADRVDRRVLGAAVNLTRAGVLAVLTAAVVTGRVSILVVLVAMALLGLAEVFADTATNALLPMVVDRADIGIGNARLMAGFLTGNNLAGPAVGAVLFSAGRAWPFLAQTLLVAFGAVLLLRMRLTPVPRPAERPHVGRDLLEGLRWTWGNAAVRTLTLTIVTFNVTWGASWSVLVLWADQRLGFGPVGFGMLSTVAAFGGVLGTVSYDWLERHFSLGAIMRAGLLIEVFTALGLALTTNGAIAFAIMFVFGAHAFVWGTTSRTIRMRSVPVELQGRVGGLYMVGVHGGIVVGQALGGWIARGWGITGPFWFAFVGSALMLVAIWGQLTHIAHEAE